MERSFNGATYCVPPIVRLVVFWLFFIARLRAIQGPRCQPCLFTAVAHVKQHQQQAIAVTGERHVLSYNRADLLSVTAARLTPDLVCRLRQLGIGYDLPRKRTRRGGRRKQRRIPTAVTAHRVPVPLSADPNPDDLVCDDASPWTVDMCLSHSKPARHADFGNLTSATLTKHRSFNSKKHFHIASFNAQSLGPNCQEKRIAVCEFISDSHIDIMFIQETWFKQKGDEGKISELAPSGYSVKSFPRSHLGGGLAVVYRDALSSHIAFTTTFPFQHTSFEAVQVTLSTPQRSVYFQCIYRTYPGTKNKLTDAVFLREFPDMLDHCNSISGSCVIVGDFNFHFDNLCHPSTSKMIDLLNTFGLIQSVNQPTHKRGHIIDWTVHRPQDGVVKSVRVSHELISDHFCVVTELTVSPPVPPPSFTEVRSLRAMDRDAFRSDLEASVSPALCPTFDQLNSVLKNVLDRHAPFTRRAVRTGRSAPWYASIRGELREAKKERRRAERQWLKTGLTVFKQIYTQAKKKVARIVQQAKSVYYCSRISCCESARQLFRIYNSLSGTPKLSPLPTTYPLYQLPSVFCDYFTTKVADIRAELDRCTVSSLSDATSSSVSSVFDCFQQVSEQDVRKIISKSNPTSCPLDPIPTPLFVECLDELLPTLTHIVNESLRSGCFPSPFKCAVVKPLLKKPTLDQNVLKNYRPVSNLSFLSKIVEKIVLNQLFTYLNTHSLLPSNQSAYRPSHCTETALVKVTSDILSALDRGDVSVLTLLDLSAAFDTVDHTILLHSLQHHYGISGTALSWFASYLQGRTQSVLVNNTFSDPANLSFGVPQGSVLGPILFIMYTKHLSSLIDSHSLCNQSFADDTQLYKSCTPSIIDQTIQTTQNCITDIKTWMTTHKLKLNDDKTEVLLIHTNRSFSSNTKPSSILVGNSDITFSDSARNLGFILSSDMSLDQHITHICRSAYAALRQISTIRQYLTTEAAKKLVCALVLSKLDYVNALLAGCPKHCLDRLQKVQNSAARLVLKAKKRDHVTPLLQILHWLPIEARIQYKLSLLCHNFFSDSSPTYISALLSVYTPARNLRTSNDHRILSVPRVRTKTFGERAFSLAAPKQWNSLPASLRNITSTTSFKKALKTYLFKLHYSQ